MVYPQVKAVIYFDEIVAKGKASYAISSNPTLFSAYQTATAHNPAWIKKIGTAVAAYVKAENYHDNRETLTFSAYAKPVAGNDTICAMYYFKEELVKVSKEAPFSFVMSIKELPAGEYPLKVVLTNNSSFEKIKEYKDIRAAKTSGKRYHTEKMRGVVADRKAF